MFFSEKFDFEQEEITNSFAKHLSPGKSINVQGGNFLQINNFAGYFDF